MLQTELTAYEKFPEPREVEQLTVSSSDSSLLLHEAAVVRDAYLPRNS